MSLRHQAIDVIKNSTLFDEADYTRRYPDVALSELGAAAHYLQIGGALGRNPSMSFDGSAYLATYLDVAARGENPLWHYETHGRNEGRSPIPTEPGTANDTADVDVIVPVFNALEDVQNCLNALASAPNTQSLRVLVINDGSDEQTTQWLRQACDRLSHDTATFQLIEHPENQGYTRAINTGLRASNAPLIVTLNSDTIVTAHWLDGMANCMASDPKIGIVGPLSNAASWQNVPTLYSAGKAFAINALPEGTAVEDMAEIVREASRRIYPRSSFVNGFCFMIRRAVLEAVGTMDEAAFPVAYGEENDFCIRAQDAGFALAYADDTYVFHAKSKSFGQEQRRTLSEQGIKALKAKHGAEKFETLLWRAARTANMDKVRQNIRVALAQSSETRAQTMRDLLTAQRILFILPVRGGGGGAHSVVQEVAAMRAFGVEAKIAVHPGDLDDYLRLYDDIKGTRSLFTTFTEDSLLFIAGGYDIVVATIYSSVDWLAEIAEQLPWVLPAYYAQDYEPLFFEEGSEEWQEAFDSYARIPGKFVFAKTDWICDTIHDRHGVNVHKVEPSLDHAVYGLDGPRMAQPDGTISICAMIRPNTPRRGAGRTMELLTKLKSQFGPEVTVRLFGCEDEEPEFQELAQDFEFINHGILSRTEVAALLRSTDVFIDLSDYQAFGRTGLEAMACGALAVVPLAGGAAEYAVDGENALIVDTLDVETCFARVCEVLSNRETLSVMQLSGIATASRYSPRRAALKELRVMAEALSDWRVTNPRPTNRARILTLPDTQAKTPGLPGLGNERLPGPYRRAEFKDRWHVLPATAHALSRCKGGDIAILQGDARARVGAEFDQWLTDWKNDGGRLIYDLNGDAHPSAELDRALAAAADVITISGPSQREQVLYNLPAAAFKVIEVPTYLDGDLWRVTTKAIPENTPLQIGYFGAAKNRPDITAIRPALEAMQDKHGAEIKLLGAYQGTTAPFGGRVNYLQKSREPNFEQSEFIRWMSKAAHWDIVVLPDQGLTQQKFWQACALQGAVIALDVPDLYDAAAHERNCLLVGSDPAEWETALERLITDVTLRQTLAGAARKEAREKWTQQANGDLYRTVLERAIHGF